jgi:hypothetical protein
VLRGATVYDGTGRRPLAADLRCLALAPGFIDIHSHTDLVLFINAKAESKIRQSVTTEVVGQDGSYILPTPRNGPRMRPLCLALSLAATPAVLAAQQTTPPLEIGAVAPDFAMNGATRYGVLASPVHLSDFKGKTVVLAFFFQARTSG